MINGTRKESNEYHFQASPASSVPGPAAACRHHKSNEKKRQILEDTPLFQDGLEDCANIYYGEVKHGPKQAQ